MFGSHRATRVLCGGRARIAQFVNVRSLFVTAFTLFGVLLTAVDAMAQDAQAPRTAPVWMNIFPIVVVFVIIYFFTIRPKDREMRAHRDFLSKLKRGDQVITASGILGRIEGLTEQVVTLEIADGVRIKVIKQQILKAVNSLNGPTTEAKA